MKRVNKMTKRVKGKKYIITVCNRIACLLLAIMCIASVGKAQSGNAAIGLVKNEADTVLPSINVTVKNNKTKFSATTTTDEKGMFKFIKLPIGTGFTFSFSNVNYQSQEFTGYQVKEGETITLIVKMKEAVDNLSDVVVVGYGSQQKNAVSGAIGTIKGDDILGQPVTGFDKAIAGKVAGVQILQSNGTPGTSATIRIRGTGSITAGNDPLVVVDGVPLDRLSIAFETINQNDIASIEVLKDAAAAAIYGSRGSNGVLLITTKQGEVGKLKISYNAFAGYQAVTKKISMMDAYQYAALSKDGHDNAYLDLTLGGSAADPDNTRPQGFMRTPIELYPYLQGVQGLTNTNWQDEIFTKAFTTNHTLSLSGGNQNVKYFVSGNYLSQEGVIINSGYKRYSLRTNLDIKSNKFKFGINFSPSISTRKRVNADDTYSNLGIVASALQMSPTWSVYNPDGTYNFNGNGYWRIGTDYQHNEILNPVAVANLIKDDIFNINVIGKIYGDYEVFKKLHYNVSLGGVFSSSRNDFYRPSTLPILGAANYISASNPSARSSSNLNYNWVIEQTLNYKNKYKRHTFTGLAGFTSQRDYINSYNVSATNFPNDLITAVSAGQPSGVGGSINEWSLVSYLLRLQYDYAGKYFVTASTRTDGSSRFGADNKWGNFPSVSAAWKVNNEKLLRNITFLSNLKLRASYGLTGNFNIGNYESISLLTNANYILGNGNGASTIGLVTNNVTNKNLGWEKNYMFNAGLDAGFWGQKLTLELNYYHGTTKDLLLNTPIPATTGFLTARQNVGSVVNKGIEASVTTNHNIGNFHVKVNANISANTNEVTSLGPNNTPIIQTAGTSNTYFITQVGSAIGSYYLLNKVGIYNTAADVAKYPAFTSSIAGDFRFEDVNGDGMLDVDKDRKIVGKYFPDYTFGGNISINYKGFDVTATFQGSQGYQIVNLQKRYISNLEGNFNNTVDGIKRWRSETEQGNGILNRANRKSTGNNGRTSTYHVEDGSYVRLQNINVSYTLPLKICSKLGISNLKFYVSGQNLYTWTNYSGYNPEVNLYGNNDALTPGVDYGAYPLSKTIVFGTNINF